MINLKDMCIAITVIFCIGAASAIGTNAGEYAAPTPAEINADIQRQVKNICDADGWPTDREAVEAYEAACKSEVVRPN